MGRCLTISISHYIDRFWIEWGRKSLSAKPSAFKAWVNVTFEVRTLKVVPATCLLWTLVTFSGRCRAFSPLRFGHLSCDENGTKCLSSHYHIPNMKITTPGMRATDEQPFQGSGCWTCLTQGSSSLATLVYFDDAFGIGIESKQLLQLLQRSKRRASRSIRYAEGIATLGLPITAWNPEGVPEGFAFFGLRAACCRFRGASLLASKFDRRTGSPTMPFRPQKLSSWLLRRKAAAGCRSPRCFAPKCPNHRGLSAPSTLRQFSMYGEFHFSVEIRPGLLDMHCLPR